MTIWGADLTSLQSFAELARREIPPGHPASLHLKRLAEATHDAGRTLRGAIFTLGSGEATLVGLCARITQFAGDLLTPAGVRCHFDWPLPLPEVGLHSDAAFELYFALKEALANVAKHARARNCRLSLAVTESELSMVVGDDGQGFDPTAVVPGRGHGLNNVRAHAEALGSRCQIDSFPSEGTSLTFSLPLKHLGKSGPSNRR